MYPFTEAGCKQFSFIPPNFTVSLTSPEAATKIVLYKKLLLNILQYSQENTCVGVSFIKRRFQYKCFAVNIAKMLSDTYFEEQLRRAALASHTKVPPWGPTLRSYRIQLYPTHFLSNNLNDGEMTTSYLMFELHYKTAFLW